MNTAERAPRPRIQNLSDLVFGLALSISALTLIGHQPTTTSDFASSLGAYGFSFLILISIWQAYSWVTSMLPAETTTLVDLNVILLFFVSIEPYLFNELFVASGNLLGYVSSTYAVDLTAMFIILAFFLHELTREEKHLVSKTLIAQIKFRRNVTILGGIVLAISIYPYFGNILVFTVANGNKPYNFSLRSCLWLVALVLNWGFRLVTSLRGPTKTATATV